MSTLTKTKKPARTPAKTARKLASIPRLAKGAAIYGSMAGTAVLRDFDPSAPVIATGDWKK